VLALCRDFHSVRVTHPRVRSYFDQPRQLRRVRERHLKRGDVQALNEVTGPTSRMDISGLRRDSTRRSGWFAGDTSSTQEPVFAPRHAAAPEDDGYVLGVVNRRAERRSDLVILDAQRIDEGPIATIKVPVRLKYGIHGNWVPGG
jgi:hypothetical protein